MFNSFCFIWFFGLLLLIKILWSDFFKLTNLYKSVIFLAAQGLWLGIFAFLAFPGHTFPLIKAIYCFWARTRQHEKFCQLFSDIITTFFACTNFGSKKSLLFKHNLQRQSESSFSVGCVTKNGRRESTFPRETV